MHDLIDYYNELRQIRAMALCDLIEYEFVVLGELCGNSA